MSSNLSNIAILIPAFNPNSNLVDLILALSKFQWKEIVIINDGSSEKSKHYFERLANINQINITININYLVLSSVDSNCFFMIWL